MNIAPLTIRGMHYFMVMNSDHQYLTYSYLSLRKAVGWIGILLPFVLMFGGHLIFKEKLILKNISLYYHTGMRDVFVGAMCAIALFLFFYRGYDKWDNRAGNTAGFLAVLIALFPTVESGPYDLSAWIHLFVAGSFFLILSWMSVFRFTRHGTHPTRQKVKRNKIYVLSGITMVVSMVAVLIFLIFFDKKYPHSGFVFWFETLILLAFGTSWLTKGGTLYPDKVTHVRG